VPETEFQETVNKASAVLRAIEIANQSLSGYQVKDGDRQ